MLSTGGWASINALLQSNGAAYLQVNWLRCISKANAPSLLASDVQPMVEQTVGASQLEMAIAGGRIRTPEGTKPPDFKAAKICS